MLNYSLAFGGIIQVSKLLREQWTIHILFFRVVFDRLSIIQMIDWEWTIFDIFIAGPAWAHEPDCKPLARWTENVNAF